MSQGSPESQRVILSALTMVVSRWNSLDFQARINEATGVKADPTTTRALYTLGLADGPVRPSELAAGLELTRPSTSKLIARLVEAGLVGRIPAMNDRRSALVELTPRGEKIFRVLFEKGIEMIARATSSWSDDRTERFAGTLRAFVDELISEPISPE